MKRPLEVIQRVGDKLIRDTPFEYRLELAAANHEFTNETTAGMRIVDFGRTFGLGRPALAIAWTQIIAPDDMEMTVQIEHNDGCVLLLDGEEVYRRTGDRDIQLGFDERSVEMSCQCKLRLKRGPNTFCVKSETRGKEWRFYMQPPSLKGAVVHDASAKPIMGLQGARNVDARIAGLTNWLVIGPFANEERNPDAPLPAGCEPVFGRMYPGLDGPVTWTIPKIEVFGAIIGWQPWGSLYHWSYYNGGTAWAMRHLATVTGMAEYREFADRFCDYHLDGIPFVEHQVKTLGAVNSANHFILDSPLLDFTLAPSLPFLDRLLTEPGFPGRERYEKWIGKMLDYARRGQVRLPGHDIYTRLTPVEYTTWVDDMFMGIPFLVHASRLAVDERTRNELLDDAASQILGFNTQVWDAEARLYMHARYSDSPAKFPFWSRCNGWAIWAMSEVLLHLPGDHSHHPAILGHFRTHAASLARCQNPDGFWPNVLDHPDSRPEVSGTAIFTMALARGVNHGWLDAGVFAPVVVKGWQALESQVEPDGTVHLICEGTMCSEDVNFYLDRPFYDNDTHGLFAVLFAGIEVEKLLLQQSGSVSKQITAIP